MIDKNTIAALLVIDQQQGIDFPELGQRNNLTAGAVILKLLAVWRKNAWPVIHIRHQSTEETSVFWSMNAGFEFKPEFLPLSSEDSLEKSTPCAFCGTELAALLLDKGIKVLVVTGASTNNSVESSVRTGGNLGFEVVVIEDGCFAFAKQDYDGAPRTAQEVHAMSLANMHGEYATVMSGNDLLNQLGVVNCTD